MQKRRTPSEDQRAIQELHRAWVSEVSRVTARAPTPLATGAGLSETVLTRIFKPDYAGHLSPVTILKISDTYRVPTPDEWNAKGRPSLAGFAEEAVKFEFGEDAELDAAVRAMIGKRSIEPMRLRTRALEDAGYLPGDVVLLDMALPAQPRDIVCAEIYEGGSSTTIWRRYDKPFLTDLTRNPDQRAAPEFVDDKRVVIAGVVVGMVRPFRCAA